MKRIRSDEKLIAEAYSNMYNEADNNPALNDHLFGDQGSRDFSAERNQGKADYENTVMNDIQDEVNKITQRHTGDDTNENGYKLSDGERNQIYLDAATSVHSKYSRRMRDKPNEYDKARLDAAAKIVQKYHDTQSDNVAPR